MKKLTIFTDPHIGTRRQAHTTRESAAALTQALYQQAMAIVENAESPVFCAGDLFDRANNPETTLVQGYNVASRCWMTLSGNHDELNRLGEMTSLQAIAEMGATVCSAPDLSTAYFDSFESIYMVPHHASQELFEAAMKSAAEHATTNRDGLASFLFLHCNYNFDLAIEDNTLNLTEALAVQLTKAFDYILIGHEHNGSTHLDGRVVVLGNHHPSSYHDLSDKYVYHLDLETAELTKTCIWSKATSFAEIRMGSELPDLSEVQFVDVTGIADAAGALEVAEFIQAIWKAGPELLAVRNSVQIGDHLAGTNLEDSRPALVDLKATIAEDLAGSDLLPLFNALMQELSV